LDNLRVLSGKQVCDILAYYGFLEVCQRGSHTVMQRRLPDTTITVPVPNHTELRKGTIQAIIRQAGVSRNDFEES
jgi:predicted RNA binding protein YcfA (HicA-like mRNA interferase family)